MFVYFRVILNVRFHICRVKLTERVKLSYEYFHVIGNKLQYSAVNNTVKGQLRFDLFII